MLNGQQVLFTNVTHASPAREACCSFLKILQSQRITFSIPRLGLQDKESLSHFTVKRRNACVAALFLFSASSDRPGSGSPFWGLPARRSPGSKEVFMIATTIKMLTLSFFWSALWAIGWLALLDGGMPHAMHPSLEVWAVVLLFLLAFACLLADLPVTLAQARQKQRACAKREQRLASTRVHTQSFPLQECTRHQMRDTQILRATFHVMAGLETFCEQ